MACCATLVTCVSCLAVVHVYSRSITYLSATDILHQFYTCNTYVGQIPVLYLWNMSFTMFLWYIWLYIANTNTHYYFDMAKYLFYLFFVVYSSFVYIIILKTFSSYTTLTNHTLSEGGGGTMSEGHQQSPMSSHPDTRQALDTCPGTNILSG